VKRVLPYLVLLFLSGEIHHTYSWDSTAAKYMPLQVGNVWVYNCTAYGMACSCNMIYRFKIVSSVNKSGKIYFIFQVNSFSGSCWNGCTSSLIYDSLRVDYLTGNVYRYSTSGCIYSPFEKLQDSLNSKLGDTVKNNCGVSQYNYICDDTSDFMIFGTPVKTKGFNESQFETGYGRRYAKGFGIISTGYASILCNNVSILKGCIINGILYGDTSTIVGINQLSTEIPEKYDLSQNYPNPFNPVTKIKFSIPSIGNGSDRSVIKIFNAFGHEVAVLVNQSLQPGIYEVDWDASNYPSGVYFYELISGNFIQTRKMVLQK